MRENRLFSTPVNELFTGDIYTKPVEVSGWDWDDVDDEHSWNFWEAIRYDVKGTTTVLVVDSHAVMAAEDENGQVVFVGNSQDDNRESYVEDNADDNGDPVEGSLSEDTLDYITDLDDVNEHASGPQMNYWYPVDHISDESEAISAALAIRDLPLCIVEVDGSYGLALCGGGMDMSWDICAAYVALGSLPPVHFSDLPQMAGESGNQVVFSAMIVSLQIAREQMLRSIERLRERFPALDIDPAHA